jgi:integration host factor subunit alpha
MNHNTLTKAHLLENLASMGFNKRESANLVEQFFELIRASLEQGQEVKISGFGNFVLRDKKERPGQNPKTKQKIPVSARRVVSFKPCQKLKNLVENSLKTQHTT